MAESPFEGPATFDFVVGLGSIAIGGIAILFNTINNHATSPAVLAMLGIGGALILSAILLYKNVRAGAWLGLLAATALALYMNYWLFREMTWPGGGFPKALFRAFRAGIVLLFVEGFVIATVGMNWSAARRKAP